LEAALSRQATDPVLFHFRAVGTKGIDSSWKMLPMKELEKLNAFQAVLADVNEDCEFFVSSGKDNSDHHQIAVYDPLVVKGYEITTKYPAYMRLPDRVENGETADVAAPVGSTVGLKILTNRPLQSGDLLWEKGAPSHGTIDPAQNTALAVSFAVKETTTFRYLVSDVNRQRVESPTSVTVTAIVDEPPTVKVLKPGPLVNGNPLSEVPFVAEVADDFGLDGGDVVVARMVDGKIQETRFPLAFDSDVAQGAVTTAKASTVLLLEKIMPRIVPSEVLTCYVELRDRKGQGSDSDMTLINIASFEQWAYFTATHVHPPHPEFFIEPVIAATWELHRAKRVTAPREFDKQAEFIASTMVDPKTKAIVPYISMMHLAGEKLEHAKKGMALAKVAHDVLEKHDTVLALTELQLALAELKAAGYSELLHLHDPPPSQKEEEATKFHKEMQKLTALMQKPPTSGAGAKDAHAEESAAAQAAQAEALKKAQAQVVEQIKQAIAQPKANSQAQSEKTATKESALGEEAQTLSAKVKENAKGDEEKTAASTDLAGAAQTMHEAAASVKASNLPNALVKAESAYQQIASASDKLNANSQDRINQLLADAAKLAVELHRKQGELLKQTEAGPKDEAAKQLGQQQVQLAGQLQSLQEIIASLQKIEAAGALKPESAKHVEEAAQIIKRSRLEQKMSNAAIELAAANAAGAAPNQSKALEALSKIRDEMMAANSARAIDKATALAQAKAQAKALKDKLAEMGAKPETKPAEAPKPKDGKGAKPEDGKGAKPEDGKGAKPEDGKGAKPEDGKGAKPKDGKGTEAEKDSKLAAAIKKALATQAAEQAVGLAQQLATHEFGKDDKTFTKDIEAFQGSAKDPKKLATELEKVPEAKDKLATLTARVSDRLEAAYEQTMAAKRLFAAQREECPPQYRQLVNRYFEALSKQGTK
jgi:hypothetical protein